MRKEQDQRDKKKNRELAKILVTAVSESNRQDRSGYGRGQTKKYPGDRNKPWVERDQCAYCKERGHWARDCPNKNATRRRKETDIPVLPLGEEDDY